jgi:hypothetical protein
MAAVPPDFPAPYAFGSVPGAQPKVLARREGERFVQDDCIDVDARHQVCEDLAQQLVRYSGRKRAERPDWTPAQVREKVAESVRQKSFAWGLSPAETEWVLRRLASLDPDAPPAGSATS